MNELTKELAHINPERHPSFLRLFEKDGFVELNEKTIDEFLSLKGLKMAVFAEDPNRIKETMDVVIIAPELKKAFNGGLSVAAFADTQQGRALAARWGITRLPAIALFRDQIYLGATQGLQPWETYCTMLSEIARREEAPARTIAVLAPSASGECDHG